MNQFPGVQRGELKTLQVNLGYRCNQACSHCHVGAGPNRTEVMSNAILSQVLSLAEELRVERLDLTGGAPELHPEFMTAVERARAAGITAVDRCNLTILEEEGFGDLAGQLAENKVYIVASLPCYTRENVDRQRGHGVFVKSLAGLKRLNQLGYGNPTGDLRLDLVYNPQGPTLPPDPDSLENEYRANLKELGVRFNSLLSITNMPIKRFKRKLIRDGEYDEYISLLKRNYFAPNLDHVMCRELISIDWRGYIYDCDFNQMLGLPLGGERTHISDVHLDSLKAGNVVVGEHCFGCTAGRGSSCGGALTEFRGE